jgi:hypothetical protein
MIARWLREAECPGVWQDKKFPTEELVAFLKTISVHRCVSAKRSVVCHLCCSVQALEKKLSTP